MRHRTGRAGGDINENTRQTTPDKNIPSGEAEADYSEKTQLLTDNGKVTREERI